MLEAERRLAAIMFTDLVGYTAMTQRNESLALELLERHNTLLRSVVKQHRGREVKTVGDAFLLEFESALEAVLCAVEIQSVLSERNKFVGGTERILVRIGIHVGDVIHRGGDVLGDAVNIASRIVSYAEQGGICISGQVYAQVANKLGYPLLKMSGQPLKNVEQPIDLYRVVLEPGVDAPQKSSTAWSRVAVLPFANISPDPRDGYFADGLTEELISALSEVKGLRVIARTSVNRYKETPKTVAQIGNELGVAFVLEGSVRKAGNKVRVGAQLIEVESQEHIWSNQYDRNLNDIFSIQSDIAKKVADSLEVTILTGERARIERKDTESTLAYVAYLKGRTLLHDRSEKAIKGAKEQFELAVREDGRYAKAYSGLADIYMILGDYLFSPFPSSLEEAKKHIKKALELDPNLAEARVSLANYLMYNYDFVGSENEFRRAIELNPSYASAHHWFASTLEQLGKTDEAFSEVMLAEELDPLSSAITLSAVYRCISAGTFDEALKRIRKLSEIDPESPLVAEAWMAYHFARREWDEALLYLKRMIEADPDDPYLDMDLAYIYAVTGKRNEALPLVEKLKAVPESARIKGNLLAFVYSGLGDLDECFRWLDYAYDRREIFIGWFRHYPLVENVRRDKRFAELLKRARLPP
jgi:adenylate cyclase